MKVRTLEEQEADLRRLEDKVANLCRVYDELAERVRQIRKLLGEPVA